MRDYESLVFNFEKLGEAYHKTGSHERALETFKLGLDLTRQLNTGPSVDSMTRRAGGFAGSRGFNRAFGDRGVFITCWCVVHRSHGPGCGDGHGGQDAPDHREVSPSQPLAFQTAFFILDHTEL